MLIPMLMPMPRISNGCFQGFCQFRKKKKELAVDMRTLYDFPYFLKHIGLLTCFQLQTGKRYLVFTY